jgi:hypothetical protein
VIALNKTAKALGITIPLVLQASADHDFSLITQPSHSPEDRGLSP